MSEHRCSSACVDSGCPVAAAAIAAYDAEQSRPELTGPADTQDGTEREGLREALAEATTKLKDIGEGHWSTWNQFAYDHERGLERAAMCDAMEAIKMSAVVQGLAAVVRDD